MRKIETKPKMKQVKVRGKYSVIRDARSILRQQQIEQKEEKRIQTKNPTRYATDYVERVMKRSTGDSIAAARYVSGKLKQKRSVKESKQTQSMGEQPTETVTTEAENNVVNSVLLRPVEQYEWPQSERAGVTSQDSIRENMRQPVAAVPSKYGRDKVVTRNRPDKTSTVQISKSNADQMNHGKESFQREQLNKITLQEKYEDCRQGVDVGKNRCDVHYKAKTESPIDSVNLLQQQINHKQKNGNSTLEKKQSSQIPSMQRFQKQQWQKRLFREGNRGEQRNVIRYSADLVKFISNSAVHIVKTSLQPIFLGAVGSVLLVVVLFAALLMSLSASPFGIFFSGESVELGSVPISVAINQVRQAFSQELSQLQERDTYDDIVLHGRTSDWADVLAVYAVKLAEMDDENAMDVVVIDEEKIRQLQQVFMDMNAISSEVEEIHHTGEEEQESWTEKILHITIHSKTADDMSAYYHFTKNQTAAMQELLTQRFLLKEMTGTLSMISVEAETILKNLPIDLQEERKEIVEQAASLVGKINYFWGGKSPASGWNPSWGELRKVESEGSPTTGTYRPYGMDCSGFVDWVFYNVSAQNYIIGQGGGVASQRAQCEEISWDEVLPGDLVFYSDDSHIGIVAGKDQLGNMQIIHCASAANNVVITGKENFEIVGRPNFYTNY